MERRSFRGEAGRPFGTVAVLLCVLLTSAAFVLGRIAFKLTGTWVPMEPDPALIPALRDYWGLLLASEIVKSVNAGAIALAAWTLAGPVSAPRRAARAPLLMGMLGAALMVAAAHFNIEAAAELSRGLQSARGWLGAELWSAGLACVGLWAALLMIEARRAESLPGWVQLCGFAFGLACLAAAASPVLLQVVPGFALVWWLGVFATLYKPEDRAAR